MDMAFIKVLNMSISASWLVLMVLVLRFLLKKTPKWISVALWALVAVRLVCPFSIESALSLIPSTQTVPEEIFYMEPPQQAQNVTLEIMEPRPNVGSVKVELDTTVSVAQTRQIQWTLLWPAGMAGMLIWALISYFRLRKKVAPSIDVGNGVFICDYIDTPFILGIVKPKIYLPSSMEPDAASHVLAHERSHIARKDHWWKPLGYLLLTVHWFNPLLWLAYILLCRDIELACDEKVIRDMETYQKKAYSEALLSCSVNRRQIAACPLAFGEVGVKERVRTVLNYKKPAFWIVLVAVIALIVTGVCFLTDPRTDNPEITEPAWESPYTWTSTIEPCDVYKAWAYPYADATYSHTIEGSRLDELLHILNEVQEYEIVARKPSGIDDPLWNYDGASVSLICNDGMPVWIRYADNTVIIGTDTQSGVWETIGYWVIENENLTSWIQNIANGGTWMLSDENRDEIRRLLRVEHVQFFDPQVYDDLLFVGCAYDNGRGLGVACFQKVAYGYKLVNLLRDEAVKSCASGSEVYYCDYNQHRIFLVLNRNVTAMEWAGAYENTIAIETHPGLVAERFPRNLGSMYRFRYGGSTTMYMDWDNQTYAQVPEDSVDVFADPGNAYSVCTNLRPYQVEFAYATELVEVDERFDQAHSYYLNTDELTELLNLLQSLPEDAFEPAEYPERDFRKLDIQIRNYTGIPEVTPLITLRLHEGEVYYRLSYEWVKPFQAYKIHAPELVEYVESFFGSDMSQWQRFAPGPKVEGLISCKFDGMEITTMKMTSFEYQESEDGLRFKPREEEGWVLLQYAPEPYAADESGLKTFTSPFGSFGKETCITGYYDESEYWSFTDVTITAGDAVSHIYLINEERAPWVKEYDDEISWTLLRLCIQVTG